MALNKKETIARMKETMMEELNHLPLIKSDMLNGNVYGYNQYGRFELFDTDIAKIKEIESRYDLYNESEIYTDLEGNVVETLTKVIAVIDDGFMRSYILYDPNYDLTGETQAWIINEGASEGEEIIGMFATVVSSIVPEGETGSVGLKQVGETIMRIY